MSDEGDRQRLGEAMRALARSQSEEHTDPARMWILKEMEKLVGTRDVQEANRRFEMLNEWQDDDESDDESDG